MFLSFLTNKLASLHSSYNQRPIEENEAPSRISALFRSTADLAVSSAVNIAPTIQSSVAQNITLIKLYTGAELIFSGSGALTKSGVPRTIRRLFSFAGVQDETRSNYRLACHSVLKIGTGTYLISFGILELLGKVILSNNEFISMEQIDDYFNDETISYMQTSGEVNSLISESRQIEQLVTRL